MSKKNKKNQNDEAKAVKDEILNEKNDIEQQNPEEKAGETEPDLAEKIAQLEEQLEHEKKEYIYRIHNSRVRDAFLEHRACFYPYPLDIETLQKAGAAFEGTHDFAAVRSVGTETKTTVRTVHWCRAGREGDLITIAVCADGFLYHMVRAIVGTMVYASHGKLAPEEIPQLLETRDRRLTGPTMPPQGLYLNRLWYDGAVGEMMEKE